MFEITFVNPDVTPEYRKEIIYHSCYQCNKNVTCRYEQILRDLFKLLPKTDDDNITWNWILGFASFCSYFKLKEE